MLFKASVMVTVLFFGARDALMSRTDLSNERGDVTSTTIVIAALAAVSLAALAIIALKITNKANSIDLG
ncbi:MAG: hypothetical protein ACSLFB_14425 [Acidimicrobiales bacterium]